MTCHNKASVYEQLVRSTTNFCNEIINLEHLTVRYRQAYSRLLYPDPRIKTTLPWCHTTTDPLAWYDL